MSQRRATFTQCRHPIHNHAASKNLVSNYAEVALLPTCGVFGLKSVNPVQLRAEIDLDESTAEIAAVIKCSNTPPDLRHN